MKEKIKTIKRRKKDKIKWRTRNNSSKKEIIDENTKNKEYISKLDAPKEIEKIQI